MNKRHKITLSPKAADEVNRRRDLDPETPLALLPSGLLAERLVSLAQDFKAMSTACDVLSTFIVRAHDLLMVAKVAEAKAQLAQAVDLIAGPTAAPTHDGPEGRQ